MPSCKDCNTTLTDDNWWPSFKAKHFYVCHSCYDIRRLTNKIKRDGPSAPQVARLLELTNTKNFKKIREGFVYIISNPAWPNWFKVGSSVSARNRCKSYQTSSPHRDYRLLYRVECPDRLTLERKVHAALEALGLPRNGEWFETDNTSIIKEVLDEESGYLNT